MTDNRHNTNSSDDRARHRWHGGYRAATDTEHRDRGWRDDSKGGDRRASRADGWREEKRNGGLQQDRPHGDPRDSSRREGAYDRRKRTRSPSCSTSHTPSPASPSDDEEENSVEARFELFVQALRRKQDKQVRGPTASPGGEERAGHVRHHHQQQRASPQRGDGDAREKMQQPREPERGARTRLEPSGSLSGDGRAYSLPPSPTVPAVSAKATSSRAPPLASNLAAEPTAPLYDAAAVSSIPPSPTIPAVLPSFPSAQRPPEAGPPKPREEKTLSAKPRRVGTFPLVFKDKEDYLHWLSGARATIVRQGLGRGSSDDTTALQQQQQQPGADPSGRGRVAEAPPPCTENWEDVAEGKRFLVTTDEAALARWRQDRLLRGERAGVAKCHAARGGEVAGEEDRAPPPTMETEKDRDTTTDGVSPSVTASVGAPEEEEETDAEERARCFRAHFDKGRVHVKPPWRVCVHFDDNHEHPYYMDWLDELEKTRRRPPPALTSKGDGESGQELPKARTASLEEAIAYYKAAAQAKLRADSSTPQQ